MMCVKSTQLMTSSYEYLALCVCVCVCLLLTVIYIIGWFYLVTDVKILFFRSTVLLYFARLTSVLCVYIQSEWYSCVCVI